MTRPAPFWRRYAAYSLDAACVLLLALPLLAWMLRAVPARFAVALEATQWRIWELADATITAGMAAGTTPLELARRWATDTALREHLAAMVATLLQATLVAAAGLVAVAALWFIGFESSARQATPAKALLGLRVTAADGGRASAGRVALRFVAGAPSWALLHLGHAMAAWTRDRRALHDLVAGTRVELRDDVAAALPGWARAWLALQVAAVVLLFGLVLVRYVQLALEVAAGGLG